MLRQVVRAFTLNAAQHAPEGLRGLQREVLRALLDASGEAAPSGGKGQAQRRAYLHAHLHHHVAGAVRPEGVLHDDALVMAALGREEQGIWQEAARGVGLPRLRAAAEACEAEASWAQAATLWRAASAPGLSALPGASLRRAWEALQRVQPPTAASLQLEKRVGRGLLYAAGGYTGGGAQHTAVLDRLAALQQSDDAMDYASVYTKAVTAAGQAFKLDGYFGYVLPSAENVAKAAAKFAEAAALYRVAAAAAPNELLRLKALAFGFLYSLDICQAHGLPTFSWDEACGEAGCSLRHLDARCAP